MRYYTCTDCLIIICYQNENRFIFLPAHLSCCCSLAEEKTSPGWAAGVDRILLGGCSGLEPTDRYNPACWQAVGISWLKNAVAALVKGRFASS